MAPHSESGKLEQVVSQFLLKSLHIILDSRIPSLRPRDRTCDSISRVRKSDKWFNLVLGDRPAALDNLSFWHRNLMDPMIIDIILIQQGAATSSSVDNLLSASTETAFSRAEEEMMEEYSFVPIEALPGRLHVSVNYRAQLSEFNLQPLTTMPPKIISDYVGSPAIDPLRYFPSSYRGDSATSFPSKGMHSPTSVPFQRPHSWTSGFHKPPANSVNQPFSGSPPVYRMSPMSYDSPSPPMDRIQNLRRPLHQRAPFQDECQLSPPFSPSVSPSTPTYLRNIDSPRQIRASSETAPVTIPFPMTGRSSRYISPNFSDPSKHSLPPLSPRGTRNDHSSNSNESPSGIRLMKKPEASKPADLSYAGHKVAFDFVACPFDNLYCHALIFVHSYDY
ncbi:Autophagy-related protein 13a [Linum perenne]